jgi:hypothetical protein
MQLHLPAAKSHYDPAFLAADLDADIACKLCRKVALHRQLDNSCTRRRRDREYYDNGTMSSEPAP